MNPIVCLGVDPAPSARRSAVAEFHVKDGKITPPDRPETLDHSKLRERINARNNDCMLLAWDAPLTGPYDLLNPGMNDHPFDFTTRPIERAFSSKKTKPPKGISVQGYAGCQHWTVTRSLLGLPRVGPFDAEGTPPLPFMLIDKFPAKDCPPRMVVEVHPALAIWLWVAEDLGAQDIRNPGIDLRYKKSRKVRAEVIERLVSRWHAIGLASVAEVAANSDYLVESDDALDAYVSGVLAALLASRNPEASIFGNKKLGMFLLPANKQIQAELTQENLTRLVR